MIIINIIIENIKLLILNVFGFRIENNSLLIIFCIIFSNMKFRDGTTQNKIGCIIIGNIIIIQFWAINLDVDGSNDENRLVIIFNLK